MPTRSKQTKSYSRIPEQLRIKIIFLKRVHELSLQQIVEQTNVKYNSIRNILKSYNEYGQTNKRIFKKNGGQGGRKPSKPVPELSSISGRDIPFTSQLPLTDRISSPRPVGDGKGLHKEIQLFGERCSSHSDLPSISDFHPGAGDVRTGETINKKPKARPGLISITFGDDEAHGQKPASPSVSQEAEEEDKGRKPGPVRLSLDLSLSEQVLALAKEPGLAEEQGKLDNVFTLVASDGAADEHSWFEQQPQVPGLPQEDIQYYQRSHAYINVFEGKFSYLNNYTNPQKRQILVSNYVTAERDQALKLLKTLPMDTSLRLIKGEHYK